jgi:two-component system, OmpR family, response regulator
MLCQMGQEILVVDDDPHTRDVVAFALRQAGYSVHEAADGLSALASVASCAPDLIVLDVGLPELDGLEVCRAVRKTSDVPILFLSSRDEEIDRILGLEIGGDDYVAKPFSPRELVARIKVILRRQRASVQPAAEEAPLLHGLLKLDVAAHTAIFNGEEVHLTATEYSLLHAFLKRPQHLHDRNRLIDTIYAANANVSGRTLDSHVRHIREKFAKAGCTAVIETVHGVGYKLGACE